MKADNEVLTITSMRKNGEKIMTATNEVVYSDDADSTTIIIGNITATIWLVGAEICARLEEIRMNQ